MLFSLGILFMPGITLYSLALPSNRYQDAEISSILLSEFDFPQENKQSRNRYNRPSILNPSPSSLPHQFQPSFSDRKPPSLPQQSNIRTQTNNPAESRLEQCSFTDSYGVNIQVLYEQIGDNIQVITVTPHRILTKQEVKKCVDDDSSLSSASKLPFNKHSSKFEQGNTDIISGLKRLILKSESTNKDSTKNTPEKYTPKPNYFSFNHQNKEYFNHGFTSKNPQISEYRKQSSNNEGSGKPKSANRYATAALEYDNLNNQARIIEKDSRQDEKENISKNEEANQELLDKLSMAIDNNKQVSKATGKPTKKQEYTTTTPEITSETVTKSVTHQPFLGVSVQKSSTEDKNIILLDSINLEQEESSNTSKEDDKTDIDEYLDYLKKKYNYDVETGTVSKEKAELSTKDSSAKATKLHDEATNTNAKNRYTDAMNVFSPGLEDKIIPDKYTDNIPVDRTKNRYAMNDPKPSRYHSKPHSSVQHSLVDTPSVTSSNDFFVDDSLSSTVFNLMEVDGFKIKQCSYYKKGDYLKTPIGMKITFNEHLGVSSGVSTDPHVADKEKALQKCLKVSKKERQNESVDLQNEVDLDEKLKAARRVTSDVCRHFVDEKEIVIRYRAKHDVVTLISTAPRLPLETSVGYLQDCLAKTRKSIGTLSFSEELLKIGGPKGNDGLTNLESIAVTASEAAIVAAEAAISASKAAEAAMLALRAVDGNSEQRRNENAQGYHKTYIRADGTHIGECLYQNNKGRPIKINYQMNKKDDVIHIQTPSETEEPPADEKSIYFRKALLLEQCVTKNKKSSYGEFADIALGASQAASVAAEAAISASTAADAALSALKTAEEVMNQDGKKRRLHQADHKMSFNTDGSLEGECAFLNKQGLLTLIKYGKDENDRFQYIYITPKEENSLIRMDILEQCSEYNTEKENIQKRVEPAKLKRVSLGEYIFKYLFSQKN